MNSKSTRGDEGYCVRGSSLASDRVRLGQQSKGAQLAQAA
jgi:hypothetical protein